MARKKSDSAVEMASVTFRLPAELKTSLEDLAASARQDTSAILVKLVTAFVESNSPRLRLFRKQAAAPLILPPVPTAEPSPKTSKAPKTSQQKNPAQVTKPKQAGGDDNAQN
ncbi:MAG: hypothetical protein IKP64_08620 [Selenomonadaceae bacterium]|nr:hypothetical protein [Selenomonadaceae bacterium]